MSGRSDDALATLLLSNHLTETVAKPLGPKGFWTLVARVGSPASLLGLDEDELRRVVGDLELAGRVSALLEASTQLAFALERFESQGFTVLTPFDDTYPVRLKERLREQAPPVLFAAGPVELLSREAIGIVGSRNVSESGAAVAEDAARVAATAGMAVVSGGARGVDQRSMAGAYQAGGVVVGYLADALERRVRTPDTRRVIGEGMVCLATPFKPSAGFSAAGAMARNKLIYAAARTTLVVATDEGTGGTWEGAVEALRHRYGHVTVWRGDGEGPGNAALIERGAHPLESLDELTHVDDSSVSHDESPAQISLLP